jgi:hypothetical protein
MPDGDTVADAEAERVAEGLPVAEGECDPLGDGDTLTVPLGETLTVADSVGDDEVVPETLAEGDPD